MFLRRLVNVVALYCLLSTTAWSVDLDRQQIRFYKANKQLQTSRIWFNARKARRTGCQNFPKKARVYQANQIGFASCKLYSKKNCPSESIVTVNRSKDETPIEDLSEGYSWFPISESKRGVKLKSWSCLSKEQVVKSK